MVSKKSETVTAPKVDAGGAIKHLLEIYNELISKSSSPRLINIFIGIIAVVAVGIVILAVIK